MMKFVDESNCTLKYDIKQEDVWSDVVTFQVTSVSQACSQKGTCRCCLSKGMFDNMELKTKEDPSLSYTDMLETVFGLKLINARETRLICSACAIRLQQALSFREQVLAAERTFAAQKLKAEAPDIPKIVEIEVEVENITPFDFNESEVRVKTEPPEPSLNEYDLDNTTENHKTPSKRKYIKRSYPCHSCQLKFHTEQQREEHNIKKHIEVKKKLPRPTFKDIHTKKKKSTPRAPPKTKYIKRSFPCYYCKMKFHSEQETEEHFRQHVSCLRCKRTFSTVEEADRHKKLHPVQCPVCDEIFETRKMKLTHYSNKHGSVCSLCNERVRANLWYVHRAKVHGLKSSQCGICEKICKGVNALHRHQRKDHMNEKNVECSQCGFRTFDQITLDKHMVSHDTDKKLTCDYCDKKFVRKSSLRYHVMIHSGLKPKVCKFCGEAFVQRASLKYHLEKRHPGDCY